VTVILLETGHKPVPQLVSEVRKSERERKMNQREDSRWIVLTGKAKSLSAIETKCGEVLGGVWELLSGDFWAEWSRGGGLYRVHPGGVIAHVNRVN
jgi:hypothetical protein